MDKRIAGIAISVVLGLSGCGSQIEQQSDFFGRYKTCSTHFTTAQAELDARNAIYKHDNRVFFHRITGYASALEMPGFQCQPLDNRLEKQPANFPVKDTESFIHDWPAARCQTAELNYKSAYNREIVRLSPQALQLNCSF